MPRELPLREIGIKAKRQRDARQGRRGASAPRNWNQGKAAPTRGTPPPVSFRSAKLESRQSSIRQNPLRRYELPLREIGIKAKRARGRSDRARRASAPRNWNQGKAYLADGSWAETSFRSAKLESRQSTSQGDTTVTFELPLREIGIKAKPRGIGGVLHRGASAPRNWNQGKATATWWRIWKKSFRSAKLESRQSRTANVSAGVSSFRSAKLESRQSRTKLDLTASGELPLREIGIKAKLRTGNRDQPPRASAPRNWNQGKAGQWLICTVGRSFRSAKLESRQSQR